MNLSEIKAQRRRRRSGKYHPHVRLHHWMLKSPAYRSLSIAARAVLVELMMRYNGSNNGRIALGVRDAGEACGISKNTAARALQELKEKGFIIIVTPSNFDRKNQLATEYALTEFRNDVSNEIATKDFMRWTPQKQNAVPPA